MVIGSMHCVHRVLVIVAIINNIIIIVIIIITILLMAIQNVLLIYVRLVIFHFSCLFFLEGGSGGSHLNKFGIQGEATQKNF